MCPTSSLDRVSLLLPVVSLGVTALTQKVRGLTYSKPPLVFPDRCLPSEAATGWMTSGQQTGKLSGVTPGGTSWKAWQRGRIICSLKNFGGDHDDAPQKHIIACIYIYMYFRIYIYIQYVYIYSFKKNIYWCLLPLKQKQRMRTLLHLLEASH